MCNAEKKREDVEVTPQMIDAGAMALVTHDPEHFSLDEIIGAIWEGYGFN